MIGRVCIVQYSITAISYLFISFEREKEKNYAWCIYKYKERRYDCRLHIILYYYISYYIIIWLNGSLTLIWAGTDELGESKLAGLGERWTGKRRFFRCKNKAYVVSAERPTLSENLHKTSVREKSRGVYLPIGWVFPSYSMIILLCWTWEDYAWLWIVFSVQRKCVIVRFLHDVDKYVIACLTAVPPK